MANPWSVYYIIKSNKVLLGTLNTGKDHVALKESNPDWFKRSVEMKHRSAINDGWYSNDQLLTFSKIWLPQSFRNRPPNFCVLAGSVAPSHRRKCASFHVPSMKTSPVSWPISSSSLRHTVEGDTHMIINETVTSPHSIKTKIKVFHRALNEKTCLKTINDLWQETWIKHNVVEDITVGQMSECRLGNPAMKCDIQSCLWQRLAQEDWVTHVCRLFLQPLV